MFDISCSNTCEYWRIKFNEDTFVIALVSLMFYQNWWLLQFNDAIASSWLNP